MIKFFQSLKYAFSGLKYALKKEQSFQIQLAFAVLFIILMFVLPLERWEIAILFTAIFLVLSLELINTTAEKIIDCFKPEISSQVKLIKDLMAAAVLVVALAAIVLGILIFLPKILSSTLP